MWRCDDGSAKTKCLERSQVLYIIARGQEEIQGRFLGVPVPYEELRLFFYAKMGVITGKAA